jgi:CheY-like chemotaxis protein/signal transduction histidine kinase
MDDVLTFADEINSAGPGQGVPWKILIADDEPSVHLVTKLALGDFTFQGRRLELLSAYGEADTRQVLGEHPDIALILLDVVMDTMDSGFTLVRYVRETLGNKDVRIIMRTGQSGNAPEDSIIINYDINDFKDKTELTVAKLRTTMISSLRTYSHLKIIAEEQRKSSTNRAYLHTVIDSLSSVLVTLDLDLKVLLWNREAHLWTGIDSETAIERNLFDVAPIFAPLKAPFFELLAASDSESGSRVERTAVPLWKGRQVFVHLILQKIPGSNGPEILFRLDDRTVAKLQDDEVFRSQRVNAFSSLAAGIAQELSRVLGHSGKKEEEPARNQGETASGLLTRLARFAPLAERDREVLDWVSIVESVLEALTPTERIKVSFRPPSTAAWVVAHPQGLVAIVSDLLENAFEALVSRPKISDPSCPPSVVLSLKSQYLEETDRQRHPDQSQGPYWCLGIEDNGGGMGPEVVDQVFDPYFTTKTSKSGLGLGLPMVYSLTEGLGGFVDLTSSLGKGTLVRVGLPAWRETEVLRSAAESQGAVLLCEDEPLMRHIAGKILKYLGFEVLEADDGPAAIDLFFSQKKRIRLIILDMVLPGLPGLEVFKQIHEISPEVPILLSSGFGRGPDVDQALLHGLAGFLQKPYRAETLGEAVRQALERSEKGKTIS